MRGAAAAGVLALACLGALPSDAAPPRKPVTRTYFFAGTALDEVHKLRDAPTATFAPARPTATEPVEQRVTTPIARGADARSPYNAYWEAPFTGTLTGNVVLRMWWGNRAPVPAVPGRQLAFKLIADPQPACLPVQRAASSCPPERVLGSGTTEVAAAEPGVVTATFAVKGTVKQRLLVMARPVFADGGVGFYTHYGSTGRPASMTVTTR